MKEGRQKIWDMWISFMENGVLADEALQCRLIVPSSVVIEIGAVVLPKGS